MPDPTTQETSQNSSSEKAAESAVLSALSGSQQQTDSTPPPQSGDSGLPDLSQFTNILDGRTDVKFIDDKNRTTVAEKDTSTPKEDIETDETPPPKKSDIKPTESDILKPPPEELKNRVSEKQPTQTQTQTETQTQQTDKDVRDYSFLPEELKPLFKRMGNNSFNYATKLYQDHQQLKSEIIEMQKALTASREGKELIPANYYEHPNAVVLDPEFQEVQQYYNIGQQAIGHWEKQLARIEAGEKWQDLGFDDKNQPVATDFREVDAAAKAYVLRNLTQAQNFVMSNEAKANQIAGAFREKHNTARMAIENAIKEKLPFYNDEKFVGWKYAKDFLNQLPEVFRGSPVSKLASMFFGVIMIQNAQLSALNKSKNNASAIAATARNAGPTQGNITPVTPSSESSGSAPTFDMFTKRLEA